MVTPGVPPIPHVGGPILPPGVPTVLIGFLPAATVTNMATCVGPPDIIAKGSMGVMINFLPSARMGDTTAHGGNIVLGEPTVMIGETGSAGGGGGGGAAGVVAGLAASGVLMLARASVLAAQGVFSIVHNELKVVVMAIRTAEVVNAEMAADGMDPAWAPGTEVVTEVVPAGTEYDMVVDPDRLQDIMEGNTRVGNWASTDPIPDQKHARDKLALLTRYKPDVSTAIKVKTKAPVMLNRGIAGPMGDLPGGGGQVQFLNNNPSTIGPSGPPRLLP